MNCRTWLLAAFAIICVSFGLSASAQAQVINISANPASFSTEGETITFTYELENLGSFTLTSIDTIVPTNPDPTGPGVTMGSCQPFPGGQLSPNESVTCTGTYQITSSNILSGQLTHLITMTGQRIGGGWNTTSSNFTMQSANGGPTLTSVESLTNPSQAGDATTFRATVSSMGCNAGLAPQGSVIFTVGPETSAPVVLTTDSPISPQGTAEFTTSTLPTGSHPVSVSFIPSGADNCAASSGSATAAHVVTDPLPALPTVNDTLTTVDQSSTDNPVNLDIDGESIQSVAVATLPSHGAATVSGTTITYTPTPGYNGQDSFTYTATNAAGTSAPATATITVEAAQLVTITWTVSGSGSIFGFTPAGSDQTNPGEPVTSPVSLSNGTVHFGASPFSGYTWSANDNCGGQVSFSGDFWQLPNQLTTDCHVDFRFIPENTPTVSDTNTTVDAGSSNNPVNLDIAGVAIESVAVASPPSNGATTISGTSITYMPDPGFSGTDSFTYTATKRGGGQVHRPPQRLPLRPPRLPYHRRGFPQSWQATGSTLR